MVICLDNASAYRFHEMKQEAQESQIETDRKKYETDRRRVKMRPRFCNHTFGVCATKELSHCYVKSECNIHESATVLLLACRDGA